MKNDEKHQKLQRQLSEVLSHRGSLLGGRSGEDADSCGFCLLQQFEGQVCGHLSDSFEVVTSYAQVWVAHLFKLMDLDSLPEHCAGDGPLGAVCAKRVSALLFRAHDAITPNYKYIPVACPTYHIIPYHTTSYNININ